LQFASVAQSVESDTFAFLGELHKVTTRLKILPNGRSGSPSNRPGTVGCRKLGLAIMLPSMAAQRERQQGWLSARERSQ